MMRNLAEQESHQERSHFCRGCGSKLPINFNGLYHKECLREDKRRRIREQRHREQEKFRRWLGKQQCPRCGGRYDEQRSERDVEASCEASQPP